MNHHIVVFNTFSRITYYGIFEKLYSSPSALERTYPSNTIYNAKWNLSEISGMQ